MHLEKWPPSRHLVPHAEGQCGEISLLLSKTQSYLIRYFKEIVKGSSFFFLQEAFILRVYAKRT